MLHMVRVSDGQAERLWRLGVASLQVAKALPLSARAYAAVHSIDAIRKSWRIGLAGLFLKDEVRQPLSTNGLSHPCCPRCFLTQRSDDRHRLWQLLGMLSSLRALNDEASGRTSLASLAGALYYSMAEQRQRRGDDPLAEAREHACHLPPSPHEYDDLFQVRHLPTSPALSSLLLAPVPVEPAWV